jgi:hypothetical protein
VDATGPGVTPNADGLPHQSFTLLLTADDGAGSGVALVEYRMDGGPWRTGVSVHLVRARKHKLPGLSPGLHLVEYRATDRVGNVGPMGSCTVLLR